MSRPVTLRLSDIDSSVMSSFIALLDKDSFKFKSSFLKLGGKYFAVNCSSDGFSRKWKYEMIGAEDNVEMLCAEIISVPDIWKSGEPIILPWSRCPRFIVSLAVHTFALKDRRIQNDSAFSVFCIGAISEHYAKLCTVSVLNSATTGWYKLIRKFDIIRCQIANWTNCIIWHDLEVADRILKNTTLTEFSDRSISLLM